MLRLVEIRLSTKGAWDLFLNRPLDLSLYDFSISGFWRSFQLIVPIMLMYVLVTFADYELTRIELPHQGLPDFSDFTIAGYVSLVIDWFFFPLALMPFARVLGIADNYVAFVILRNWSQFLMALIATPLFAAFYFDLIGSKLHLLGLLTIMFVFLHYRYIVTRAALECSFGLAVSLVALEFALSMVIGEAFARLFGVGV
ncbi:hypothetical protein [Stappia sp. ES.058]|uniref:hypothetical protein n=1 Tax=Stappia sp. ES.058 TaxID=1881061 RepID=UPI00087AE4F1|nr:hypothetical protein [Stappia sp. ES.058]SDT89127.1 hypothetical protein SAMN05428979_0127 [Stappia sp. ES.058]